MPLHVTDYTWTQTDAAVHITVPLKGAKPGQVDIVSTDEYLKAFLFEPVDDDRSTAKVGNGVAVFSLPKKTSRPWDNLVISTNDKAKKREIRETALEKHQQKLSSQSKQKAEKQQAEKKYALKTMMKLEKEGRDRIQQMKDAEREKTSTELAAWQLRQQQEAEAENQPRGRRPPPQGGRSGSREEGRTPVKRGQRKQAEPPPPRPSGNIQISFTPRVFPTALRESRLPEEEEWLRKQAEARRAVTSAAEELQDLTEEERNPDWLKDKGDKCFGTGDFRGAVNAYSLALRLNPKLPALFSNRAACHLKLRNLHKAIEDASKALELLTPAVPANAAARARAGVRRGSAFCQLQLYAEGLLDYEAALRIDPQNEALRADAQRIRAVIQGSAANQDAERGGGS